MLTDGFYSNTLNEYCRSEGLDYMYLLSEAGKRKFPFFHRKKTGNSLIKAVLKL